MRFFLKESLFVPSSKNIINFAGPIRFKSVVKFFTKLTIHFAKFTQILWLKAIDLDEHTNLQNIMSIFHTFIVQALRLIKRGFFLSSHCLFHLCKSVINFGFPSIVKFFQSRLFILLNWYNSCGYKLDHSIKNPRNLSIFRTYRIFNVFCFRVRLEATRLERFSFVPL